MWHSRKKSLNRSVSRKNPIRRVRLVLEELESRIVPSVSFVNQPQTTAVGLILAPITVSSTGVAPVTLSLGNNQNGLQLQGTVTQNVNGGKAVFNNLVIAGSGNAASKNLTLIAQSGSDVATSSAFVVKPGDANLYISPLSTVTAGSGFTVTVNVLGANGALVRSDSTTRVQLYIGNNPGGAQFIDANGKPIAAPLTATVKQGVATFTNVRLDKAGIGYTIGAEALDTNQLPQTTSNAFVVSAAEASGLAFVNQPTYTGVSDRGINVQNGFNFHVWTGVTVQVVDKFGNAASGSFTAGSITISAFDANNNAVNLIGTPTTTIDPTTGVAAFGPNNPIRIGTQGNGYTLKVAGTVTVNNQTVTLTEATSTPFNVGPQRAGLWFLTAPPTSAPMGETLPTIKVAVVDASGNTIAADNTDLITLNGGDFLGTRTVQVQNGVATFSDIMITGRKLTPNLTVPAQFAFADIGGLPPISQNITLLPGQAYNLAFANTQVHTAGQSAGTATAGEFLQDGNNNSLSVSVVDHWGNTIATDNSTIVNLGILRTNGRGPVFIGQSATAGDVKGLQSSVNATVTNGVAVFNNIYINYVANTYILAAGTATFATHSGATTSEFNVVPGAAAKLLFANTILDSNDRTRFNVQGNGLQGVTGLAVYAVDKVGNINPTFNGPIQLEIASGGSGGTLKGVTTVNALNGVAIFNQAYIQQNGNTASSYTLQAASGSLTAAVSNSFQVAVPQTWTGTPQVQFVPTTIPDQNSGQSFTVTLQVTNGGTATSDYNTFAHIIVELRDAKGNPLPNGPFLEGDQSKNMPTGADGKVTFTFTINAPVSGQKYTLLALLDLNAQALLSNAFTVTGATGSLGGATSGTGSSSGSTGNGFSANSAAVGGRVPGGGLYSSSPSPAVVGSAPPNSVVQVGLGSYTNNYDYYSQFPSTSTYGSALYYPPSSNSSTLQMIQPNVAAGFNQTPITNKFWSSLIFPRNTVAPNSNAPADSQGNELYPLYAEPFAAMVNSNNNPSSPSNFAGLGLSNLTNLFVTQSKQYEDTTQPKPPGQPNSLVDPRYPGAVSFEYPYGGNTDARLYQDFSIGLKGVQADGKVLSYSDWTVTLDWAGKLQATLGEGLPYVYFTAPNANGQTIQLVTAPKSNATNQIVNEQIYAYNSQGESVLSGTGAVQLEIKYTMTDGRDPSQVVQIDHYYGLFLPGNVAWTLSSNTNGTLTADLTSQLNYFSVATLPDKSLATFNYYRQRAYSFVTGSTSNFSFDPNTGKVTTTYALQTKVMQSGGDLINNQPLQALYLTQYNNLSASDRELLTSYSYTSPFGTMKVWAGPVFSTVLQYQGTLPDVVPLPLNSTSEADLWHNYLLPILQGISTQTQSDGQLSLDQIFPNDNNYLESQSMFGAMQLVPILLEIGQSTDPGLSANDKAQANSYAEQIFNQVKNRMGSWLSAQDDQSLKLLYYQPATPQESEAPANSRGWQSLMSILAGFLSSQSLNDHQLINGYFVKTAAMIEQYDPTWANTAIQVPSSDGTKTVTIQGKLGDIINMMINDVADGNHNDGQFPYLRNFDPYVGHSWADGAANNSVGTNLESSSEALNFDSAVIQWGQETGSTTTRDLGVYLYTTELAAVQTYWFNVNNTSAFPAAYTTYQGNTVRSLVTKLNGDGGAYGGFIGSKTTAIAGIQILPLNGASYYLGYNPNFVSQTYNLAITGGTQPGDVPATPPTYLSVMYPYLALSNPTQALQLYTSNIAQIGQVNPGDLIDNNAFNIHWIEGLQAYGQVDGTVTANTVSYTVFKNPTTGARTFAAYNPDATPASVTFKDATGNVLLTLNVPGQTLVVADANGNILNQLTNPNFSLQAPNNRFFFSNAQSSGSYTFSYGKTGTGESAVNLNPVANTTTTFKITGLTGTLQGPDAQAYFDLWLDPQYRASGAAPGVQVSITYDQFGNGRNVITQKYDLEFSPLSNNAGYVEYRSPANGGMVGPQPYFSYLQNGTVTFTITVLAGDGKTPVRLRTNAAAQQGRVSYLDLPYNLTVVGGQPVSQLNLGGYTLGSNDPLPSPEPSPPPALSASVASISTASPATVSPYASGSGWTATLNGSTATFLAGPSATQMLQITVDPKTGLLMNNLYAAGVAGFNSPYDFDSTQPGDQTLAASAVAKIIIENANNDSIELGSNSSPASSLLAHIVIDNTGQANQLGIEDGARTTTATYTIDTNTSGSITTANQGLNVQVSGNVFSGGISLVTGGDNNNVEVLSTRDGESVTLNTSGGQDTINVGAGNTTNILGNVAIDNTNNFSTLILDNSQGVNASANITVSRTSIVGVAPASIDFSGLSVSDVEIYGGTNAVNYSIVGANSASYVYLQTGAAANKVAIGGSGNFGQSNSIILSSPGGNDSIAVNPLANTSIEIDGPTGPTPGNQLNVNLGSAVNPTLVLQSPHSGTWTFANAQPIAFSNIAQFNNVPIPPSPSPSPPAPPSPPGLPTGPLPFTTNRSGLFDLNFSVQPTTSNGQPVGPSLIVPFALDFLFQVMAVERFASGDVMLTLNFLFLNLYLGYDNTGTLIAFGFGLASL
ncbi:MAG: glycosyl hydrolase [Gemmataceae bacterium]